MPFLIPSLDELMRQLMGIFVRKEAIPKHSYQLPRVDVAKRENQLLADESISLPTATPCKLKNLQATENAKLNFKVTCKHHHYAL